MFGDYHHLFNKNPKQYLNTNLSLATESPLLVGALEDIYTKIRGIPRPNMIFRERAHKRTVCHVCIHLQIDLKFN